MGRNFGFFDRYFKANMGDPLGPQWCPTFLSIRQILETKCLGGNIFHLKIKNMSIIPLFKHLKGAFSIQVTF
jgi:hypothetical protein